jgi:hypothetical protein
LSTGFDSIPDLTLSLSYFVDSCEALMVGTFRGSHGVLAKPKRN